MCAFGEISFNWITCLDAFWISMSCSKALEIPSRNCVGAVTCDFCKMMVHV